MNITGSEWWKTQVEQQGPRAILGSESRWRCLSAKYRYCGKRISGNILNYSTIALREKRGKSSGTAYQRQMTFRTDYNKSRQQQQLERSLAIGDYAPDKQEELLNARLTVATTQLQRARV